MVGSFSIRRLDLADRSQLESLFETCFKRSTEPDWYLWKYRSNPNFDGISLGLFEGGRLVGHYAGFPRPIRLPNIDSSTNASLLCEKIALQIGDVMVHPRANRGISRSNQFVTLVHNFLAEYINDYCPIAFGFPNFRAFKQGLLAGKYASIGTLHDLTWTVTANIRSCQNLIEQSLKSTTCQTVIESQERVALTDRPDDGTTDHRISAKLRSIAEHMLKSESARKNVIAVKRSVPYWLWRFPEERGYVWLHCDCGAAVLRKEKSQRPFWRLLDWACPPENGSALFSHCIEFILSEQIRSGDRSMLDSVTLWTWASSAPTREFANLKAPISDLYEVSLTKVPTDIEIAVNMFPEQPLLNYLPDELWVIAGDTDFL